MPKKKDDGEPTTDEMAAPPTEQPVETPGEIPEPPPRQDYPDAPILKADDMRGEVITIVDGAVFESKFQGEETAKRRAVVVFRPDADIPYRDREGEKLTLAAGEVGKFFTSSRRVVYAMDEWVKDSFAAAKHVKVIVDPESRGKGIKFTLP